MTKSWVWIPLEVEFSSWYAALHFTSLLWHSSIITALSFQYDLNNLEKRCKTPNNHQFIKQMHREKNNIESTVWNKVLESTCIGHLQYQNIIFGPGYAKSVFGHMQTAKARMSLCIHAVWSGSTLSATESLDTIICMNGEQRPRAQLFKV